MGATLVVDFVSAEEPTLSEVAGEIRASVVIVRAADRSGALEGIGSGFVVAADGVIATNYHVIGEGREFTVRFADGREARPVEVLGFDRRTDVAVFRVDAQDLQPLTLAAPEEAAPGTRVVSVGNPLGFDFSVATGVIAGSREFAGRPMLQLAMPIERGNSGSPVVDVRGRVVGMLAIKTGSSSGFAVPASDIRAVLERPRPVPIRRWRTIGRLDARRWTVSTTGGRWRQRAGRVVADGQGDGFGGRMLCLSTDEVPAGRVEIGVEVKLAEESGAAGLVFHADSGDRHYGFYPTAGSLRLTRFEGPSVFSWTILETVRHAAYRPGEWNAIKVQVDGVRIRCFVNDQEVISVEDEGLSGGRAGLCKFREPSAEFRSFRVAEEIPPRELSRDGARRVVELAAGIPPSSPPAEHVVEELAGLGDGAVRTLTSRARELEEEAFRVRHLAELVHQRRVENRLHELLRQADGTARPDAEVDLVHASLLVAALDNRDLRIDPYLELVDRMADDVREAASRRLAEGGDRESLAEGEALLEALVTTFRDELGFRGSRSEYYHRSNSYLNEVLDDREGLPITLSIVLIELARRVGLPVVGVGVPRHFLVAYAPEGAAPRLLDVYEDCREIDLDAASVLSGVELKPEDIAPASKRSILLRVLRNLIGVASQEGDVPAVVRYLDATLRIDADDAGSRWQRAVLRSRTGQPARAVEDLDHLLANPSPVVDADQVRALRAELARRGF